MQWAVAGAAVRAAGVAAASVARAVAAGALAGSVAAAISAAVVLPEVGKDLSAVSGQLSAGRCYLILVLCYLFSDCKAARLLPRTNNKYQITNNKSTTDNGQ